VTTLVTGGNGWLPSHVVRRLAGAGETVVSYDLMEPDDYLRAFLGADISNVVFEAGDVTDRERLREAAARHGVTSIVSAAAITPRVDRERREPERIIAVNLGGVVNALEVARELPNFRRFVQISSCAVFGDVPGVTELDEDSPANSTNLYGITKLAGERVALRYGDLFGLDVIAVRPSNVYGPMERFTPGYAGATELREMLRIHFAADQGDIAQRLVSRLDLRRGCRGGDRTGLVGYGAATAPGLHRLERRAVLDWQGARGVPRQSAKVGVQGRFPG
jgi:nucleoside-diphosphate-sugar epimerase